MLNENTLQNIYRGRIQDEHKTEKINVVDYAERITKALPEGILLNTQGEKFNSMVIGWGHLGVIWNLPTITVYVRQSRYTKTLLDETLEFTVSAPVTGKLDQEVFRICGAQLDLLPELFDGLIVIAVVQQPQHAFLALFM